MTNDERRVARAEVESARAALVTHLNELEDAVNIPKRIVRASRLWGRKTRHWATEQPAAAAGVGVAALAVVAGVIVAAVRISRR